MYHGIDVLEASTATDKLQQIGFKHSTAVKFEH